MSGGKTVSGHLRYLHASPSGSPYVRTLVPVTAQVQSRAKVQAQGHPACGYVIVDGSWFPCGCPAHLFSDGLESGDAGAWTGAWR